MNEYTLKELVFHLQKRIDVHMKCFTQYHELLKLKYDEIEELEKKMFSVVTELEPVQSLIYNQNPSVEKIFESLKRIYTEKKECKDNNGKSRSYDLGSDLVDRKIN